MEQIVTGSQMKQLDKYTIETIGIPSLVLMERAALSVYEGLKTEKFPLEQVEILCGSGNNGADGVVVGRLLHLAGYKVRVCILGKEDHFTEEMKTQISIAEKYGVPFTKEADFTDCTTIVDAVFGVGLTREVQGKYREVFEQVNASGAAVMAVDVPSGVDAATGRILGCAIKADVTVTFAYKKAGLLFYPGATYGGKILTADIGIYQEKAPKEGDNILAYDDEEHGQIPFRPSWGNKGTFGKALLIAGNKDMMGAAILSATACQATGTGMLKIVTREENKTILPGQIPESMYRFYGDGPIPKEGLEQDLAWADVIGIGPGLGRSEQAGEILEFIFRTSTKPMVVDADALNLLSERLELLKTCKAPVILTPHLGEFQRLSGISPEEWKKDPLNLTKTFAKEYQITLLCKDARTVISDGGGNLYINTTGNSGMATAGSGDVLAGILLGLLAQGMDPLHAACLGAYLHGEAGDLAAAQKGEYSMTSRDLISQLMEILKKRGNIL